jgi:hypothetical protein
MTDLERLKAEMDAADAAYYAAYLAAYAARDASVAANKAYLTALAAIPIGEEQ